MENDQNDNTQTPTPNLNTQEPGSLALVTKVPKTPKLSNLTKLQKLVFILLVILVVTLGALTTIFYLKTSKNVKEDNSIKPSTNIQALSCEESKIKLSQVNSQPESVIVYNNVKVDKINGSALTILKDNIPHIFILTDQSKIEKEAGSKTQSGSAGDLKSGMTLTMIRVNPMGEVVYAIYTTN